MKKPTDPPATDIDRDTRSPLETLPASSVYQKLQELLEDYENGHIQEEELGHFLQELHVQDEEHFLDQMDEYNAELRLRLQKIDIARRALEASGIVDEASLTLDESPEFDAEQKKAFKQSVNEQLLNVKDLGDAKQVTEGLDNAISKLEVKQRTLTGASAEKMQNHVNSMRDIAMGLKVDYLGSTRTSLGTGTVLQGPLGEIMGLGFDKLQVEADNDGAKYISGYISTQRNELSSELRATAKNVNNRPKLSPLD